MENKEHCLLIEIWNFVYSDEAKKYNLLLVDKLILLAFASHHGKNKLIFPSLATVANGLEITVRYLIKRLDYLVNSGLIIVNKSGRNNTYKLPKLSTIGEPQFTYQPKKDTPIGELQFTSQVNYSSPHRCPTVHPNTKVNTKTKRERGKTKSRAPLSVPFKPDQRLINMAKETAKISGKTVDQLIIKFQNIQIDKDATSANWNLVFENFLINEKPALSNLGSNHQQEDKKSSCVSQDWGPGHPAWESLHGGKKLNGNGKNKLPAKDSIAGSHNLRKATDYLS